MPEPEASTPAIAKPFEQWPRFPLQARDAFSIHKVITIPWQYAEEAYKEYSAQFGTQQSLQRLSERGGFGAEEIIMLLVQRIQRIEKVSGKVVAIIILATCLSLTGCVVDSASLYYRDADGNEVGGSAHFGPGKLPDQSKDR